MHPDGTVQTEALTYGLRLDCDWRNDHQRNMLAGLVRALRRAILALEGYYTSLHSTPPTEHCYKYVKTYGPKPASFLCWLPYKQSYNHIGGSETRLSFIRRFDNDRLLFEGSKDGNSRVMIKFVRRYAKGLHTLLAEENLAPHLYGLDDVSGGWKMVVMEYMPPERWVMLSNKMPPERQKYKDKIKEALELIHDNKFVHGDVRPYNILVPEGGGVDIRVVDFDDSGINEKDKYPREWNDTFRPTDAKEGALLRKDHDWFMYQRL